MFKDKILQKLHKRVEKEFGIIPDIQILKPNEYFSDLAQSIIGQQLSTKVADKIVERVKASYPKKKIDAKYTRNLNVENLRACGISNSKAQYIKNIAEAFLDETIKYKNFPKMSDEDIIAELVTIKGVGRWTAEMFLIFSLGRSDVFSAGDYGLRKAVSKAYGVDINIKPKELIQLASQWSPNRTLASRILWKSLELTN